MPKAPDTSSKGYWEKRATLRFGPIPPEKNTEAARLIAASHYAFIEGALAALAATKESVTQ